MCCCSRGREASDALISQKVFVQSFCESRFPYKSVTLSFIIASIKNKLTDLCRNRLLQSDLMNTSCEITSSRTKLSTSF